MAVTLYNACLPDLLPGWPTRPGWLTWAAMADDYYQLLGVAKLAKELLPALDNLERALAAAEAQPENRDHHLTDGIRLVQSELLGALARVGIEPESPKGEQFDPHRHEALAQQPAEGAESGTIIEVYSAGYRIGDEVLRPAKVVVAA